MILIVTSIWRSLRYLPPTLNRMRQGLLVEYRHRAGWLDDRIGLLKGTICYRINAWDFVARGERRLKVDNRCSSAPPILEQHIRVSIFSAAFPKSVRKSNEFRKSRDHFPGSYLPDIVQ